MGPGQVPGLRAFGRLLAERVKLGYQTARSQAAPRQPISECVEKSSNIDVVTRFPCAVGGWASVVMGGGKPAGSVRYLHRKGIRVTFLMFYSLGQVTEEHVEFLSFAVLGCT